MGIQRLSLMGIPKITTFRPLKGPSFLTPGSAREIHIRMLEKGNKPHESQNKQMKKNIFQYQINS